MTAEQGMTVFFWLFICTGCLAMFWQLRADYYRNRLKELKRFYGVE